MIIEEFTIPGPHGDTLAATNLLNMDGDPATALLLHGMHVSGRQLYARLAEQLAEKNIGSLRFDQPGWGDSPGTADQTSLQHCLGAARFALQQMEHGRAPLLIGHSMGGYIAARLLEFTKPDALVLFCPAAYPNDSEHLPIPAIRRDDWYKSLAFDALRNFQGRVLLVHGDKDELIPTPVFDAYEKACRCCVSFERMILPGAPHGLQGWLQQPENMDIRQQVLTKIAGLLL